MASGRDATEDQSWVHPDRKRAAPSPGLVAVWSGRKPALTAIPVGARPITIGRGDDADVAIDDRRLSRAHVEVARDGDRWRIADKDSHNGTFADAIQIDGTAVVGHGCVVRAGDTLLVTLADVGPLRGAAVEIADGIVIGPTLRAAYDQIAAAGEVLHLRGETGSGKELAARYYHDRGPDPAGPFVAVNCAAIPTALAEGLLFGVRKGAYSGADADRDGYLAAADGGTLFLDEIAELSLDVQAKLLRALETGQITPLGATRPRTLALRLCTATHGDLRALAAAGTFRDDLYYRIGRPTVELPPLRERREEMPYLAVAAIGRAAPRLGVHPSLIEQLLLRPWPGNTRELLAELADAAGRAVADGSDHVTAAHLAPAAGTALGQASEVKPAERLAPSAVAAALERTGGNVAAAARELGVHRNQLRRHLAKDKGGGDED